MNLMRTWIVAIVCAFFATAAVDAEVVTTVDGASFEGTVVSDDSLGVVVTTTSGTVTLPREVVTSVRRNDEPTTAPSLKPGQRIPGWLAVVTELSGQPWALEVRQIPATVIDKGIMRNVPYQSYRCGGGDYELNIYGDPDDPAAVELGLYRDLLKDAKAKQRCVDFVASVMVQPTDAGIVRAVDSAKDLIKRNGLTVEITPETAEDSYGGWWVSVYSETSLDQARASQEEMRAITVTAAEAGPTTATTPTAPTPPYTPAQARATPSLPSVAPARPTDTWTAADMAYARPSGASSSYSSSSTSSYAGSGPKTVYVRAYTRKDGTYVHAHTRSAPGYGRSSGSRGGGRR